MTSCGPCFGCGDVTGWFSSERDRWECRNGGCKKADQAKTAQRVVAEASEPDTVAAGATRLKKAPKSAKEKVPVKLNRKQRRMVTAIARRRK